MLTDLLDAIHRNLRPLLLWTCGLLLFGFWFVQLNPYLNVADDAGRYMVLGESLSRTGDLRLLNDIHHPLDTLYPPGYPMLIALWLLVTGHDMVTTVFLVKTTQIVLMIAAVPLMLALLTRARLPWPYIVAGMALFALSPTIPGYANEVMSETLFLFLTLAVIVALHEPSRFRPSQVFNADDETKSANEGDVNPSVYPDREIAPSPGRQFLALACAAGAFMMRTAGIALLITLVVWYWRRYGARWGLVALLTAAVFVGGWQMRNRRIVKSHPEIRYSTYLDQFSLKDPDSPNGGRIPLTVRGILSRVRTGFPAYIGMIPRTVLYVMAPPGTIALAIFYLAAIPITLCVLIGVLQAWKRDMKLAVGFSVFFWLFAALWPWRNARFIVPLLPLILVYLCLGLEFAIAALHARAGRPAARAAIIGFAAAVLAHFARADKVLLPAGHKHTLPQYDFGRTLPEGGFYSACFWLKYHAPHEALVMGRPAYLLHLYSGHPTSQIEPATNPNVQEKAYMARQNVRYLVYDAWPWSHTRAYLGPYMREYADRWTLAWQDPNGSGVQIWQRK